MHIIEVIPSLAIGGAEVFATDLADALRTRGHTVDLLCISEAGPLLPRLSDANRATLHIAPRRRRFDPALPRAIAGWLRERQPDVVHTHLFTALLWASMGARIAGGARVIHTQHGVHDEPERLVPWVRRALGLSLDGMVACSPAVMTDIKRRRYAPTKRVSTILNGIPLAHRPLASGEHTPLRIGHVGRLVEIKGQRYLIEAVGLLRARGLDVSLEIVGDGPERDSLQALVHRLHLTDRVSLVGARDDVPARLADWDLFVLPSLSEAMPVSLLEAAAAGLPLIATDAGGAATLLREGGAGVIAPPADADALAHAISLVATASPAERHAMGQTNRNLVLERYDIAQTAASYEALFESVFRAAR